ncbi:YlmC/YmxH family sporulation protein [Limnochorda pilosa]|uniref:YlmC/YmxH family sporulation protein n=1 Tax=Limnochorda pilosa TaxID=1555112 RepID=A0A0K2SMR0_LIMPI|nr:YlmC/YmxH family sporulation protein [Limnochorda pilosa]BAS28401.1 YlmC/YmxH family sporulation protein [Limnochorda pilosa]
MRYSELSGKEIIDIDQGIRLGVVNESDVVIDTETGRVEAILVPYKQGFMSRKELRIPWRGIRKIGVDLMVVDLATAEEPSAPSRWLLR